MDGILGFWAILSILLLIPLGMMGGFYWFRKSLKRLLIRWIAAVALQMAAQKFQETMESVQFAGNTLRITYTYLGAKYKLHVPFQRSLRFPMSNGKMFLVQETGNKIDISQQPGVPYLVSARLLGGKALEWVDSEGHHTVFELDEIPVLSSKKK